MRDIKFRAWDEKEKYMIYEFIAVGGGEVLENIPGYEFNEWREQEDYIALQYTGLKDKNGKECFDGDILRDQFGQTYFIVWADNEARWELEDIKDHSLRHFKDVIACEVIGNIYENPELLQEDNNER